jgi:hypothetical protein
VHISFSSNQRFDAAFALFAGSIKLDGTKHISMVSQGQSGHFILFSLTDQTRNQACTIKKTVMRMVMQMDKLGHGNPHFNGWAWIFNRQFNSRRSEYKIDTSNIRKGRLARQVKALFATRAEQVEVIFCFTSG